MRWAPVSESDPSSELSDALSELIAFDREGRAIWPARQLEEMLLTPLGEHAGAKLKKLMAEANPPITSAKDLLEHRAPSVELLAGVKDLAKRLKIDRAGTIAPEMSLVLYYGSIAAGLVRCGVRISKLRDEDLKNGFTWVITQQWVGESMREVFREGLRKLTAGPWRNP